MLYMNVVEVCLKPVGGGGPGTLKFLSFTSAENRPVLDRFGAPCFPGFPLVFQLLLGFVFQLPDVLHRHPVPAVRPTKDLTVEIVEKPTLCRHDERLNFGL